MFKAEDFRLREPGENHIQWTSNTFPITLGEHAGRYLVVKSRGLREVDVCLGEHEHGPAFRKNFDQLEVLVRSATSSCGPKSRMGRAIREAGISEDTVLQNRYAFYDRTSWGKAHKALAPELRQKLSDLRHVPPFAGPIWHSEIQFKATPYEAPADFMPHGKCFQSEPQVRILFSAGPSRPSYHQRHMYLTKLNGEWRFLAKNDVSGVECFEYLVQQSGFPSPEKAMNYLIMYLSVTH